MTDRHAGYIVTLEKDIREDDAEVITGAIKMIRGVAGVEPVVSDVNFLMAQSRLRLEWMGRFTDFYQDLLYGTGED